MANTPPKQGVRARERNAIERIGQLESDLQSIVGAVQNALQNIEGRVNAQTEILDAIIQEVGAEQINARIEATREARAAEQAVVAKEGLAKALEKGEVVAAPVVSDKSVITGIEYDKDGTAVKPGYVQLGYNTIKPEFQEKILGQQVGFKFDTESGSFEVTGIFNVVDKPEEAVDEAPASPSDTVQ
jgi:hypothetical protein